MIVGCYTLDLYCDHPEHNEEDVLKTAPPDTRHQMYQRYCALSPGQYTGETYQECIKTAKAAGWYVSQRARQWAVCPIHNKKKP